MLGSGFSSSIRKRQTNYVLERERELVIMIVIVVILVATAIVIVKVILVTCVIPVIEVGRK